MARLKISLLGDFRVTLDGEPVTSFAYDKVRALLAYLAVEAEHTHRRETIAGLLWPEQPERSARQSLSQALSRLRRAIGDEDDESSFLIITAQSVQFDPASDYWLDATAFAELLTACEAHDHSAAETCEACADRLAQAVALYGASFLEGFSVSDSAPFEEWMVLQREQIQRLALDALYDLTNYLQVKGDYEGALSYALRQVDLDPWQERAHRQVMVLYAQMGRRASALRQYEACRQLLAEELGAEPSRQTQELHAFLLEGELPPRPGAMEAVSRRESRAVGACPYRGLAAFREVDSPYFFGREDFTQRLLEALHARPLVAVIVGSSGSGKSSVAFAGLLPRLRGTSPRLRSEDAGAWLVVDFRPSAGPFHTLAGALLPLLEPDLSETDRLIETRKMADALASDEVRLYDVVARALEKNLPAERILLLVDQFEELYALCPDADKRDRFLDLLLAAVEAAEEQVSPSLVLLLTLRADFMGQALSHRPFADALQEGALMLGPMTREELRDAIGKPAEVQGAAFEAGLVERLLDDVGQAPGNLPLLEFALTLLWARLDRGWMTHAAYEEIGRVEGALTHYAERVYGELRAGDQEAARRVFVQLVQPGEGTEDTRRVATRSELGAAGGNWALVQHLADKRLVVTGSDPTLGHDTVEVVHEALIQRWGRLQNWIEEDRAFRTWQERLRVALRGWEGSDQDEGALLRGAPLAEAEGWLSERGEELSPAELGFVEAGVAQRERRQAEQEQRRRRVVLALAGGLLIALILVLLAGVQWQRAEGEVHSRATAEGQALFQAAMAEAESDARATAQALAEAAEGQALRQASVGLAAQALTELEGASPERAVLLALEALENYPYTPQAESALGRAVNESKSYVVLDEPGGFGLATRAAWSPDGRLLAVGGSTTNAVFTLWEVTAGEQVGRIDREDVCITHYLAWSPEGDRLVTSAWYPADPECESVQVWDVQTGSELLTLAGHQGPPGPVDWSPDGSTILSAGDDGTVRLWDADTGEERQTIPVLPGAVRDVRFRLVVRDAAWSPSGDRFVTAAQDGTARVWQLPREASSAGGRGTTEELMALSGHAGGLTGVAWSPDGERLATAGQDGTVKVWLTATGEATVSINAHDGEVESVAWSPDGLRLATAGTDGTVKVWLADTGGEVFTFRGVTTPYHLAWSPDGVRLVVRGDNDARVLDLARELPQLVGHTDTVVDAQWSPDGRRVATAGQDGSVKIWDVANGEELRVFDAYPNGAGFLAWSPDGERIVTTGRQQPARIWDAASGELLVEVPLADPEGEFFYYANWSPDGSRIVGSSAPHYHAVVLDARTGETITTVTGDSCGFPFARWSPEGDRFITSCAFADGDTPARIWDAATGALLGVLESQDGVTNRARWSPDGRRVAVAYSSGPIKVYETAGGETLLTFAGHPNNASSVAWSPDGGRVASGDEDGMVKVWDATTGEEVLSVQVPGYTNRVEWSPDGKHLIVSGGFDVPVVQRVWQSTEELIEYARECCVFRELTDAEREQYGLRAR